VSTDIVVDLAAAKRSCRVCNQSAKCLPQGCDSILLEQFDDIKRSQVLQRSEYLFRQGDTLQSLFLVRSGSVKIYSLSADGDEQVLGFYLPGDLIGLDAIETGIHACSAATLETSSICEFSFTRLDDLTHSITALHRQMNRLYGREISRDIALLRLLGNKSAEQRLAGFLYDFTQRLSQRGLSEQEFNLSMSRHDIANYLGLAVETISRLFARLQDDDVLSVDRRHITVRNPERLQQLAGVNTSIQTKSVQYYH